MVGRIGQRAPLGRISDATASGMRPRSGDRVMTYYQPTIKVFLARSAAGSKTPPSINGVSKTGLPVSRLATFGLPTVRQTPVSRPQPPLASSIAHGFRPPGGVLCRDPCSLATTAARGSCGRLRVARPLICRPEAHRGTVARPNRSIANYSLMRGVYALTRGARTASGAGATSPRCPERLPAPHR